MNEQQQCQLCNPQQISCLLCIMCARSRELPSKAIREACIKCKELESQFGKHPRKEINQ